MITTPPRIKRLLFDFETSPNVCLSWRVGYKINLDHSNILKERAVICVAYKWHGESEVHALHWDGQQDDKKMLAEFVKVVDEADELVGHNIDQYDLPWLKTRCLFHGLPTLPDYKTIDTLQWARRKFAFNSNRLDYIGKFLGCGGKIKTEFALWKRIVLEKDKAALDLMVRYCKRDVDLLEKVYDKLARLVKHKTHAGVVAGLDKWTCSHCGSKQVKTSKKRISAAGTVTHQMQCQSAGCGAYFSISDRAHEDYKEAKGLVAK